MGKKKNNKNVKKASTYNNNISFADTPKKKSNKKLWNVILIILAIVGIGAASLVLLFALYIIIASPNFDRDLLYKKESTILFDNNGKEIESGYLGGNWHGRTEICDSPGWTSMV